MSKNHWWGPSGGGLFQGFPWGFNPGRQRFFETGEVRLAILSLLAEGPKHGYQLMKEMQDRSGGFYRASADTNIVGGNATIKITLGGPSTASRY